MFIYKNYTYIVMVKKQDEERADNFLKCLGRGKSMVEIENEEE